MRRYTVEFGNPDTPPTAVNVVPTISVDVDARDPEEAVTKARAYAQQFGETPDPGPVLRYTTSPPNLYGLPLT